MVAGADVVALAIARGRVVNLEEEFEDLPIADLGGMRVTGEDWPIRPIGTKAA
jgi:hypothetical protein